MIDHRAGRRRRPRTGGWTQDRTVTFILTLAATGSVTLAAAAAGLSRKSAYARRAADPGFAALWKQALAASGAARFDAARSRPLAARKEPALSLSKGDKADKADTLDTPPTPSPSGDDKDLVRASADAERDRFFAGLEMRLPAAFRDERLGLPLANGRKPSNGGGFDPRASAYPRLARP